MPNGPQARSSENIELVSNPRLMKKADDDSEAEGSGSEAGSAPDEYEIEEILDSKKGYFEGGKMGYFVRWKGYGSDENSWVNEDDAGNADALIADYWAKQKKGRKTENTPKQAKPRKSGPGESLSTTKKRGRKSTTAASSDADIEMEESRGAKKSRKNGAEKRETASPGMDEDVTFGDMSKYRDLDSWEDLVQSIDTIEREDDSTLYVYFRLKTGERVKEQSAVCRRHCPQKLITFYEANLRWKTASEHDDS